MKFLDICLKFNLCSLYFYIIYVFYNLKSWQHCKELVLFNIKQLAISLSGIEQLRRR